MKVFRTGLRLFFAVFLLLIASGNHAEASRLAILPFADISSEENGAIDSITEALANKAAVLGYKLVDRQQVMTFLVDNLIRDLGYLQTYQILRAKKELNADYLLLGSICQKGLSPLAFGLTLTLYRTSDASVIWNFSDGISIDQEQRLLGIDVPENFAELRDVLLSRILSEFPPLEGQPGDTPKIADSETRLPDFQIDAAYIFPPHVRTGQKVTCSLQLRMLREQAAKPKVFIKAGNTVYQADESVDGHSYEVSWNAPQPRPDQKVAFAMYPPDNLFYEGTLEGGEADETYLISAEFIHEDGSQNTVYIGSYTVDNTPPQISIVPQGTLFDGKTYFQDSLPLAIQQTSSEPITRWSVSIFDKDGTVIMQEDGRDALPSMLQWQGTKQNGVHAQPGRYLITLEVLDRAGNLASAESSVYYDPTPPTVAFGLTGERKEGLALLQRDHLPITRWKLEIWDVENNLLKNITGETLPAEVIDDYAALLGDKDINATLFARNLLGKTVKADVTGPLLEAIKNAKQPQRDTAPPTGGWIENF